MGKRYPAYDRGLQGLRTGRPTVRGNWDAFSRDPLGGRSGRSRQGHPRRKDPHDIREHPNAGFSTSQIAERIALSPERRELVSLRW
jgi:hypothetical protein